ncbi:Mediator of RNA polymerase II transcription subunit 11 [Caenorhabditis elegans]|uniref:Mediator of RNA polymerase II transcription subunit 11 n=1 Tax=Caenorhabditis elegans TaxID=6239 RepID=MED11_CAEEL|nr:Mediator of RNA polymerase II transcription subunit 11 [Caenorhabditis elegans]Q9BI74.1 RecName: Full=Mediator of RNA polymerase II transcription subunit 11; AltName: Full=Mediator complex subunit 11 [Caenorhabditis elegans]CCD65876.1 Mediator of RNA polymerase II transcription subunit 11 [Caenorhabditis elegans]|eukprot:NP_498066.1 Mediator of RNA polymerase II transcription subunit 11 [Caenorhabditis elegans]
MEPNPSDPVLTDRIQAIVTTEKSIDEMMKCAREIIQDLGKEKQIGKNKMEDNANNFKKLITQVENELSAQMQYLSHVCVGSSHQGSTFGVLQNSLLAQSGLSSLHSELFQIVRYLDPTSDEPQTTEEDEEDGSDDLNEDGADGAPSSTVTSSTTDGSGGGDDAASSSAPRSQEESGRQMTDDDDDMEQ